MSRYDYDDDQVVVVERDGGGMGIGAFALGLAIGAAAALLWAPASGEETRAKIRREARRAKERALDLKDDITEQVTERAERVRDVVDTRLRSAREGVTRRARDVGDAVNAGRDAAAQARYELDNAVVETKRAYAESRAAARAERADRSTAIATDNISARDGDVTEG